MSEHIISDEVLASIRKTCYEAGKRGAEVFTVCGADGEEIVRCRDCKHCRYELDFGGRWWCVKNNRNVTFNGFCAWGERES